MLTAIILKPNTYKKSLINMGRGEKELRLNLWLKTELLNNYEHKSKQALGPILKRAACE